MKTTPFTHYAGLSCLLVISGLSPLSAQSLTVGNDSTDNGLLSDQLVDNAETAALDAKVDTVGLIDALHVGAVDLSPTGSLTIAEVINPYRDLPSPSYGNGLTLNPTGDVNINASLVDVQSLDVTAGGSINVNSAASVGTRGSQTWNGDVTVSGIDAWSATTADSGADLNFNGAITGSGGSATLTANDLLTITGSVSGFSDLTIDALVIEAEDVDVSGNVLITNATTSSVNSIKAVDLTKNGTGSLTVEQGSVLSGNTTLNGGNLRFNAYTTFAGTTTLNSGNLTLESGAGFTGEDSVVLAGGNLRGSFNVVNDVLQNHLAADGTGGLYVNGASNAVNSSDVHLNGANLTYGGSGIQVGAITQDGGTIRLNGLTIGDGVTENQLSGNHALEISGTVTIASAQDYTGGTTINSGLLTAAVSGALGTGGADSVVLAGGGLRGNADMINDVLQNRLAANGTGTLRLTDTNTSAVHLNSANLIYGGTGTQVGVITQDGGTIKLGAAPFDEDLVVGDGVTNNQISGSYALEVYDDVTIASSQNYTGGTTVNGGTLTAAVSGALGSGGANSVVLAGGRLRGDAATINDVLQNRLAANGSGGLLLTGTNSSAVHLNGANLFYGGFGTQIGAITQDGGTVRLDDLTIGNGVVVNQLSGSDALLTFGSVTIASSQTYTGGTTVTSGWLTASVNGALGAGDVNVSGGRLSLAAADVFAAGSKNIIGSGGDLVVSHANALSNVNVSGSFDDLDLRAGAYVGNPLGSATFSDLFIGGTASVDSINLNQDEISLGATGALTNSTVVANEVFLSAAGAAVNVEFTGVSLFNNIANGLSGTSTLSGNDLEIRNYTNDLASIVSTTGNGSLTTSESAIDAGALNGNFSDVRGGGVSTTTLTSIGHGEDYRVGGVTIAANDVLTGGRSLTVTSDTLISGNQSFTGETEVLAGNLTVDGSLQTSGVTVGASDTLSGSGSIAGAVVLNNGATLAPGNSPGTLTLAGGATFNAGSTFSLEVAGINPGEYDDVLIGGDLTFEAGSTIDVTADAGFAFDENQTYVFDIVSLIGGSENIVDNGVDFTSSDGSLSLSVFDSVDYAFDATTGEVTVMTGAFAAGGGGGGGHAAVPEPSTTALLGLGGLALAARRKRKDA